MVVTTTCVTRSLRAGRTSVGREMSGVCSPGRHTGADKEIIQIMKFHRNRRFMKDIRMKKQVRGDLKGSNCEFNESLDLHSFL